MTEGEQHSSMCIQRKDVEDIVDKSSFSLHDMIKEMQQNHEKEISALRNDSEKRMTELARSEVASAKDSVLKYVGFGGIVSIVIFVYYVGGISNKVENMQSQLKELQDSQKDISAFMTNTSGNRFTLDDGNKLKTYVDQNDGLLQKQLDSVSETMKSGFAETKDLIKSLHDKTS